MNGKEYVGVSNKPLRRIKEHYWNAQKKPNWKFANAINKYGWDAFTWEILDYTTDADVGYEKLEVWWIAHYDSYKNGYNMTKGGSKPIGNKGRKFTKEHKRKIGKASKDRKHSKETRQKMSDSSKGHAPTKGTTGMTWEDMFGVNITERQLKHQQQMIGNNWNRGRPAHNRKHTMIDGVEYKSIAEAAKMLSVCRQTIIRWVKSQKEESEPV